MDISAYEELDALGLAELVRQKQVSPLEVVETAIRCIEARNPVLNAVIHTCFERAREEARRPAEGILTGVPLLLKDLLSPYAHEPHTEGSCFLKDWRPSWGGETVRRLQAAGAIILGKTNTPELGLLPYTEPECFGPTRNPWALDRTPGGSSGGSGAAVAARMVPVATGSDGGGSIRIPSSCCGVFGLKPTRGRTPTGPVYGELWEGFLQEHVLTRSVRDSAAILDMLSPPETGAPYRCPLPERPFLEAVSEDPPSLRIAVTTTPFMGHEVHPDCEQAVKEAALLLESLGHHVEEAAPEVDGEALAVAFVTMLIGQVAAHIQLLTELSGRTPARRYFEPTTWTLFRLGHALPASRYTLAIHHLQQAARRIATFFETYDLLLTPTLACPPLPIGALQPSALEKKLMKFVNTLGVTGLLQHVGLIEEIAGKTFDFIPYTPLFNITGQPAMSVPLYWNADNLPVGVQLAARFADEWTLLQVAGQLERARPWHQKKPPLS